MKTYARKLHVIVVLVAVTLLTACDSGTDEYQSNFDSGQRYASQGDYSQAVASYTKAIADRADSIEAYNRRAAAYRKMSDNVKAVSDYKTVVEIASKKAEAKPLLAQAYADLTDTYASTGNYEEAATSINKSIQLLPDEATLYNQAGDWLKRVGM